MSKVKIFKRMAFIMMLSAVCTTTIGCADTKKAGQSQAAMASFRSGADNSATKPETSTDDPVINEIVQLGESITIDGYQTVDGANLPIRTTFEIADIQRGEKAYTTLRSGNAELLKPENDMEYIVVKLNVTYDKGETDSLDLSENYASMYSEKRFFALSNGDSNAEQMTANLMNSIYNLSLKKGISGQGAVAFLHKTDSTEPLTFIGFGNVIRFSITN